MQREKLRKFTETRARAPRARYALILPRPELQYACTHILNLVCIQRSTDQSSGWIAAVILIDAHCGDAQFSAGEQVAPNAARAAAGLPWRSTGWLSARRPARREPSY